MELITKFNTEWTLRLNDIEEKHKKCKSLITERIGELSILKLMNSKPENLFLIRGYKDRKNDQDDDRQILVETLKKITLIHQNQFCFDPNAKEYGPVRDYVSKIICNLSGNITQLMNISEKINELEIEYNNLKNEIASKKKQFYAEFQLFTNEVKSKQLEELDSSIKARTKKIDHLMSLKREKEQHILNCTQAIEDIEGGQPQEYGNIKYQAQQGWFRRAFYDYFGFGQPEWKYSWMYDIPLERVEASSIVFGSKVVFPTPVSFPVEACHSLYKKENIDTYNDKQQSLSMIHFKSHVNEVKMGSSNKDLKQTGQFEFKEYNLSSKKFSFILSGSNYEEFNGAVRFFVLPKNIPSNKTKCVEYKDNIKKITNEKQILENQINSLLTDNHHDKKYLDLLLKGQLSAEDKLKRIVKLCEDLGINFDKFVRKLKKFINNVKEKDEYEKDLPSITKTLLNFTDPNFYESIKGMKPANVKEDVYCVLLGESVGKFYGTLEESIFENLEKIFGVMGLNFSFLNNLAKNLVSINITNSLKVKSNQLENIKNEHKYVFQCYNKYFFGSPSLRTILTIVPLLQMETFSQVSEFEKKYKQLNNMLGSVDSVTIDMPDSLKLNLTYYQYTYQIPIEVIFSNNYIIKSEFDEFYDKVRCKNNYNCTYVSSILLAEKQYDVFDILNTFDWFFGLLSNIHLTETKVKEILFNKVKENQNYLVTEMIEAHEKYKFYAHIHISEDTLYNSFRGTKQLEEYWQFLKENKMIGVDLIKLLGDETKLFELNFYKNNLQTLMLNNESKNNLTLLILEGSFKFQLLIEKINFK